MKRDVHSTLAINAPKFLCGQVWASLLRIQEHMIQSLYQQIQSGECVPAYENFHSSICYK